MPVLDSLETRYLKKDLSSFCESEPGTRLNLSRSCRSSTRVDLPAPFVPKTRLFFENSTSFLKSAKDDKLVILILFSCKVHTPLQSTLLSIFDRKLYRLPFHSWTLFRLQPFSFNLILFRQQHAIRRIIRQGHLLSLPSFTSIGYLSKDIPKFCRKTEVNRNRGFCSGEVLRSPKSRTAGSDM